MELTQREEEQLQNFVAQAFDFARNDEVDSLKIMLEHGLNVNLTNDKGNTLLMLAAYNNSLECAKLLLSYGAEVDRKNDKNQTPLAGVCFKGYTQMAKLLLEYGANPYEQNGFGLSPMNCAIMFRRKEILELFSKQDSSKMSRLQRVGAWFYGVRG